MYTLLCSLLLQTASYFVAYPKESAKALEYCRQNENIILTLTETLPIEDAFLAMCIVAPEIGQSSTFINESEIYAMKVLYVQGELADFSIGPFQMKPTFAVEIEEYVANQPMLSRYRSLIIDRENARETRYERVCRLSSLEWQLLYLSAFIDIVREKTKDRQFKDPVERLRYWSTLYNSGMELSAGSVMQQMTRQQFPRAATKQFNYADICVEFYLCENFCTYLK